MLERILSDEREALLADERRRLRELQVALARLDAKPADLKTLERSVQQLDELFLLVVVGEFNSGKSTFINALLGSAVLEVGVTPTTQRIHRLLHGDRLEKIRREDGLEDISAPVDLLRRLHIVDTPGTNSLQREHEAITQDFIPRSDLVLFVTSADRPFTESERAFLEDIRRWGKKVLFAVNKIDFVPLDADVERIRRYMEDNARRLLGFAPEIFPVSAQRALQAKRSGDEELLAASLFPVLERYLMQVLDEVERVRLKLLNPLGVGLRLAEAYLGAVRDRERLLRDDFETLDDIDGQLHLYEEDLGREFRFRLTDVDNLLHELEKRGMEFFDETVRLARFLDLLNKAKTKVDFERRVIAETPRLIDAKVREIIDWLVAGEQRQWQTIAEHLNRRRSAHAGRVIGQFGSFDHDRQHLIAGVSRVAQGALETYDREREAARMAESVQEAVARTALIEAGAVGLGTLVTLMATTQLADITGIVAAGTLAVLGLFVLPARRQKAKRELTQRIGALRQRLMEALTGRFDHEVEASVHRIRDAIAPYTRFVRAERQSLGHAREGLEGIRGGLSLIKLEVEGM